MAEKEGDYCTICGGIVPEGNDVKKLTVDGKEVGIKRLDFILDDVKKLNPESDYNIKEELIKRICALNYISSKKREVYAEALLKEYKKR